MANELAYFQKFIENLSLYNESETQGLTQKSSVLQRNLNALKQYASPDYKASGLENVNLDQTQKLIADLTSRSTQAPDAPNIQSLKAANDALTDARSAGDMSKVAKISENLSPQVSNFQQSEKEALLTRQSQRVNVDPQTMTPSSEYINTLGDQLKKSQTQAPAIGATNVANDSNQKTSLLQIHKNILGLNSESSVENINSQTQAYAQYQENLSKELSDLSNGNKGNTGKDAVSEIAKKQTLADFMGYPNAAFDAKTANTAVLPMSDQLMMKNIDFLQKTGQIKLPEHDAEMVKSIVSYHEEVTKAQNVQLGDPNTALAHVQELASSTQDPQKQQALSKLNGQVQSWSMFVVPASLPLVAENVSKKARMLGDAQSTASKQSQSTENRKMEVVAGEGVVMVLNDHGTAHLIGSDLQIAKQVRFEQAFASMPSQQVTRLQSDYLTSVAKVTPSLLIAQSQASASPLLELTNANAAVMTEFSGLKASALAWQGNPSSDELLANYQAHLQSTTAALDQFKQQIPTALAFQSQLAANANALHDSLCPCVPDMSFNAQEMLPKMTELQSALDHLPKLPQLPQGGSFDSSAIVGPYTASLNAILAEQGNESLALQASINAEIMKLQNLSQNLPKTPTANMQMASCLCDEVLDAFSQLKSLIAKISLPSANTTSLASLSDLASFLQGIDLNTMSLPNVLSLLKQIQMELDTLCQSLANAMSFSMPPLMGVPNLPPLSVDLLSPLQDLQNCLSMLLNKEVPLPSGVSMASVANLNDVLAPVLNYQHQFIALDQQNFINAMGSPSLPNMQALLSGATPGMSTSGIPSVNDLIPETPKLLNQLQSCENLAHIEDEINEINSALALAAGEIGSHAQKSKNAAKALDEMQAKTIQMQNVIAVQQRNIQSAQAARQIAEQAELEVALANLNNSMSNTAVLSGQVASALSASSGSPQATMVTCTSSQMLCTFGLGPGMYSTLRATVLINNKPAANITDAAPMVNILPMPSCTAVTNPAWNPLKPISPCIPAGQFIPTNIMTMVQGSPINTMNNKAMCTTAVGGVISFINPSQMTTMTG
ncbi:DUF4280 domain-containing protein [Cysteiniphilum sp. JM-1]|uniref:DUF4280 domain-containing protein n=1 Tax=Cysteiniphilum sp. JM-1 TaxID=2610891 RepID=UPI001248309C|nr:DUF4280 domain-containing protein [Cysteiniphilum sp. JM-1]